VLQGIIDEEDYSEKNDKIDAGIARTTRVKRFTGKDSAELKYDRDFEMNCIVLGKHSTRPVKQASVKEYFTLIRYFNKENEKNGRQPHKTR